MIKLSGQSLFGGRFSFKITCQAVLLLLVVGQMIAALSVCMVAPSIFELEVRDGACQALGSSVDYVSCDVVVQYRTHEERQLPIAESKLLALSSSLSTESGSNEEAAVLIIEVADSAGGAAPADSMLDPS